MGIYRAKLGSGAATVDVEVHYRIKPWGVDLDEVYIAGTPTKLPLTAPEYYWLTKRIGAELAENKSHE